MLVIVSFFGTVIHSKIVIVNAVDDNYPIVLLALLIEMKRSIISWAIIMLAPRIGFSVGTLIKSWLRGFTLIKL